MIKQITILENFDYFQNVYRKDGSTAMRPITLKKGDVYTLLQENETLMLIKSPSHGGLHVLKKSLKYTENN